MEKRIISENFLYAIRGEELRSLLDLKVLTRLINESANPWAATHLLLKAQYTPFVADIGNRDIVNIDYIADKVRYSMIEDGKTVYKEATFQEWEDSYIDWLEYQTVIQRNADPFKSSL